MTHNAAEIFTMQLARSSAKQANRFLAARGLQKSDRDDVIAAAMLWCWENRDKYSLTTTLETWFMNAIRDAYKTLQRGELPISDESIENMGGGDTTYDTAAAESAAKVLMGAMTRGDRVVARFIALGYTRRELVKYGHSQYAVDGAHARIKQLRRLLPDHTSARLLKANAVTPPAEASDDASDGVAEIDIALEQLDFAPPAGKDCPPCWKCMWYEGFMPLGKRSTGMEIEDTAVREAVKNTEARKIEIAQQVRDGV